MMLLGVGGPSEDLEAVPYLHSPGFDIDEKALGTGVEVFAHVAFDWEAD